LIKAFQTVKDNSDSGQFIPIQKAASFALSYPEITEETAKKYSRRHELLVQILQGCGFEVEKPKGSFYLYAEAPIGVAGGPTFQTAEEFSQYLIREHLISTVPWDDAGSFIRFSVTFEADSEEEELQVMKEIERRLKGEKFIFKRR